MIRMFQSVSGAQAKEYFKASLSRADYYIEGQEHQGHFHGSLAERLGLNNRQVTPELFNALCDNLHPVTKEQLTPRTIEQRRVGYDISFHCPKSVSILHALGRDDQVLKAFQSSVSETMHDMEKDMLTRVRVQGQSHDRHTGQLLYADFVHETARPVDGHPPDPHLHMHCFAFNVTWDDEESRYKAGQFHDIKRDMPYYQALFQKRLADRLQGMGYAIRKTQNGFDLAIIPQAAIDHFSKRTNLIGQVAQDKGIVNKRELDQLGARTRSAKQSSLTMADLQRLWREQLKKNDITPTTSGTSPTRQHEMTVESCVDYTLDHAFTRASVRRMRQLQSLSYLHAIDNATISPAALDLSLRDDPRLFTIHYGNQELCTTELVHVQEREMVQMAMQGKGGFHPLSVGGKDYTSEQLSLEQVAAIQHILTSTDQVMMVRGGAGTGKTTMIKHAVAEIERTGKQVHLFAPTSDAARHTLRSEGFENADTVAALLSNRQKHSELTGQVIWVDEAGMLGTQDMHGLLNLAKNSKARLILSGDPRQHTAVQRGDAMRILNKVANVKQVSLETIFRQKQAAYKQAVMACAQGDISTCFERLESMGALRQSPRDQTIQALVDDYCTALQDKRSALVISPTNAEREKVTAAIRNQLKDKKLLKKRERVYQRLDNLYLSNAQKQDRRSYMPGQVIQLHQNIKGATRGAKLLVETVGDDHIKTKDNDDKVISIPFKLAERFDVYTVKEIALSKGDPIRVTKNGFDAKGKRLDNGWTLNVKGFTLQGQIKAVKESKSKKSEFILDKSFANFDHGYCLTSYGAQGKTVDQVFIHQPAETFPATNTKQFYVSISRARDGVTIYTDDKDTLREHAHKLGDRVAAVEAFPDGKPQQNRQMTISLDNIRKDKDIITKNRRDYEHNRPKP